MQITEYFTKKNFISQIEEEPSENLSICIVLPAYNEPNLYKSLLSLIKCQKPKGDVEVIVVINHPENSSNDIIDQSEKSYDIVTSLNLKYGNENLRFYTIKAYNLPSKFAGVGLARQIGMDEAAFRLLSANKPNGTIACFDADATCMNNYLVELENLWLKYPKTTACSIRYAHPITGIDYPKSIYTGIAAYELHLRYYNQASRYINFPFSFHTIGSSMASSALTYAKFGGMNRHQAGEDFYFLQKIIPHGNFRDLNTTCIFPSPRPSTRVPFGTGRAMLKYMEDTDQGIKTYNLHSFLDLAPFLSAVDSIWELNDTELFAFLKSLPKPLSEFLEKNNAVKEITRVKSNTSSQKSFQKRFFLWFDAFLLLKYLNYANEHYYTREPVDQESIKLGKLIGLNVSKNSSVDELLEIYREKDLEEWNPIF